MDRPALAGALTRGFLAQALDHGLFHADLHEGNLFVAAPAALTAVDFGCLQLAPVFNPLSHLVYAVSRRDVSDVWVDGRARVRDRVLIGVDIDRLVSNAARWAVQAQAAIRARGTAS